MSRNVYFPKPVMIFKIIIFSVLKLIIPDIFVLTMKNFRYLSVFRILFKYFSFKYVILKKKCIKSTK